MFPGNGLTPKAGRHAQGARTYLTILQILLDYERTALPFDPMLGFQLLSEKEYSRRGDAKEYRRLMNAWQEEHLYELICPGTGVIPYRILSHIAGIHYIAMIAACGLEKAGVEVDLSLIFGAVAVYDFRKFGCCPGEWTPYLHHYYTNR